MKLIYLTVVKSGADHFNVGILYNSKTSDTFYLPLRKGKSLANTQFKEMILATASLILIMTYISYEELFIL